MSHITAPAPTIGSRGNSAPRAGAVIAGAAAGANLLFWAIGRAFGTDYLVAPAGGGPGHAQTIGPGMVVAMTVVPVILGSVLLALTRGASHRWWPRLAAGGLAVGILTVAMPLAATASAGARALLAVMHVVAGAAWFIGVRWALAKWVRR